MDGHVQVFSRVPPYYRIGPRITSGGPSQAGACLSRTIAVDYRMTSLGSFFSVLLFGCLGLANACLSLSLFGPWQHAGSSVS